MIEYILIVSACIGVACFIIAKMADVQDEEKHEMIQVKDKKRVKEIQLENIYPKYKSSKCGDWFHMPYKYCRCDK